MKTGTAKTFFFSILLLLVFQAEVFAIHIAVLETVADGEAKNDVSLLDKQYLTNVLREQAIKELPAAQGYTIMTRENILQMLPPGKSIEECEGSCLVETGKNISADYVCQARVGRFGASITISAELYETAGNKLISSFNGRGASVEELLVIIEQKSSDFFKVISASTKKDNADIADSTESSIVQDTLVALADTSTADTTTLITNDTLAAVTEDNVEPVSDSSNKIGESIPTNIDDTPTETSSKIHWIPISISAVAVAAGVTLAIIGNVNAKNASEKDFDSRSEYEDLKDEVHSYQRLRTIGIGVAIAGALGLTLSFVF
jgi:hypothetical protein